MWATTVTQTGFTKVSDSSLNGDTKVSYTSYKGGGTSDPALSGTSIRLYQNSGGNTGGYIVIGVANSYVIKSVSITTSAATTAGYKLVDSSPGSSTPAKNTFNESNHSCTASGTYTVNNISSQYVVFANFGTTNKQRLDISAISVTYEAAAVKTTTSLSISPNPLNLTYGGGTGSLTATVTPEGGSALVSPAITWEVTGTSGIASVDENGVVTPLAEGSTVITATYDGDNTYNGSSNTATVTVTDSRTAVVSAITSINSIKGLYIGGKHPFTPVVTLADGLSESDVTYSYVSADPATIQINDDGTYTALKTGTNIDVTVTVTPIAAKLATHKPVSATFQHNGVYKYSKPIFTPTGVTEGNFSGSMTLEMANDGTPTGPIYYTLDGEDPATDKSNGTLYENELTLTATMTVKARVIDNDGYYSTVTSATYTKVPANKDAISLAVGQSLSFTNFSGLGDYGTDKETYVIASDGDKYKFTSTNVGYYSSVMQIKDVAAAYTTLSPVTSTNGFKMTVTTTQNSVKVYVGGTEKTAVDGVYYFSSGDAVTLKRNGGTTKVSNITFTALKPTRSVTFEDGDQVITVDGETITKTATISPAGTATYTSSDAAVATVNATTGEVTALKGGSAVITATVAADEDYEKSTGSYKVTVNKAATTLAFAEDEITVELVDGTDAGQTATASPLDGTRVITYSTEADGATVNSSTGALTFTKTGDFTIKANATATDKYEAPSEASYTLHVQDSRVPIVDASKLTLGLTDALDNPIALNGVQKDDTGTLAASYTTATGFSGTEEVTYTSSDDDVLLIDDNEFAALKGGVVTVTVTITSGGDKMFTTVEKEFTVTVTNPSKTATEITVLDANTDPVVDGDVLNLTYGTPVALDVDITSGYEGTISKVLGNSSIVGITTDGTTVTITPAAIGSTTLTFSAAETANYQAAANIAVTINVAAPTAQTSTGTVDGTVEDLDFSKYYVPETWTVTTTNVNEYQAWTDNESNDFISANGYKNSTRYAGTYDYITDEYDLTRYSTANLEFEHAGQYFNTISDGVKLFAEVDGEEQKLTINTYFEGTSYNKYVKNTTSIDALCGKKAKIIFRYISDGASTNTGRWDIKSFKISGQTLPSEAITVASSGFSTYCYQYPLDLDLLDEDVKAYIVTDVSDNDVTFKRVTGTIKGGVPFILYGTAGEHTLYTAASSTNVPEGNMLVGTLAPTYITATNGDYTNFGLKNGKFVKATNGVIGANKAYLPILTSSIGSGAHEFNIIFDERETTAISEVRGLKSDVRGEFYNLNGQRVATPVKGNIYIVNGKKVMFK